MIATKYALLPCPSPTIQADEPNTEREQQRNTWVTTDNIVLSITHVSQRSEDVANSRSTDMRSTSGSIVQSIARIHQLFRDVVRTSKPLLNVFSDVADLAPKLRIQQVAFDNGCKQLFVTAAKSRQDVDDMIENPGHPIWKDTTAHRSLEKVVARFYHLCLKALEHFQQSLFELKVGLQAMGRKRKGTWRSQNWLKGLKSPTLGTTENFPELVQNLRNYNDLFCTLIWQAVPHRSDYMLGSSFAEDLGCPYAIGAVPSSYSHSSCIKRASQVLYDTLSDVWTCHDHKAHYLSISLNFDCAKPGAIARGKGFRFIVGVTSPYFDGPYRIVVDAAQGQFCTCQTAEDDRSSKKTFKGNKFAEAAARTKSSESSDIDTDIAAHGARGRGAGSFMRPESMEKELPDLGLEKDLCTRLRKLSASIESKQEIGYHCLGYLETTSGLTFLLSYIFRGDYGRQASHSLDDVLVRANSERRAVPLEERLRIASFLAAGVLNLNTSSWLPQTWSSKNILFFGMDDYKRCTLEEPLLQVQLVNDTTRQRVSEVKTFAAARSGLLSLGLVLIELAFSAPWRKLQFQDDITKDLHEWERDLLNLMHLSETVSRELGSRYAKVVQTCLFQGLGGQETHGLRREELDRVIYEDVVRELDQCLSAVTFK